MLHEKDKVFYDIEEVKEEGQTLQDLLYNSKRSVPLKWVYPAFLDHKVFDKNHTPTDYFAQYIGTENRHKFVQYILTLLKEGKIKMKIRDTLIRPINSEEVAQREKSGIKFLSNLGVYESNHQVYKIYNSLNSEQGAHDIKKAWSSIDFSGLDLKIVSTSDFFKKTSEELLQRWQQLDNFEEWSVFFTLPENEWEM